MTGDSKSKDVKKTAETDEIKELISELFAKDQNKACGCASRLLELSSETTVVYAYFELFCGMLSEKNSYLRMRAFALISANARYDSENKINEIIRSYLTHINDEKPICARKCIESLPEIARQKPELVGMIIEALETADTEKYADSMSPLIKKDIKKAICEIKNALSVK